MSKILLLLLNLNVMFDLPEGLLPAVCSVESDFRNIVNENDGGSPSYGICQIKLKTAKWIVKEVDSRFQTAITPETLMDPVVNGATAALYLAYQLKRYKGDLECVISAYNAGRCIKSNQNTYVRKVKKRMKKYAGDMI